MTDWFQVLLAFQSYVLYPDNQFSKLNFFQRRNTNNPQFISKIEIKESFQSSFCEATIMLVLKTQRLNKKENYRPVSIKNIGEKNSQFANQIEEHIKKIIYLDQIGFIPKMQRWFSVCKSIKVIHHIIRLKDRNHRIISLDVVNAFDKIPFMMKVLERLGYDGFLSTK